MHGRQFREGFVARAYTRPPVSMPRIYFHSTDEYSIICDDCYEAFDDAEFADDGSRTDVDVDLYDEALFDQQHQQECDGCGDKFALMGGDEDAV